MVGFRHCLQLLSIEPVTKVHENIIGTVYQGSGSLRRARLGSRTDSIQEKFVDHPLSAADVKRPCAKPLV